MKALIFDVDGTLAETEETHRLAFNDAFHAAGLDWSWGPALYRDLLRVAGGKERIAAYQRDHRDETPNRERIATLHADKTARYARLLEMGGLGLRPGIAELIGSARAAGLRLAIATTTSRANVDALCRCCFGAAADSVFDVIAAGDEVAAKKPAPDVYRLALERLGLAAEDCLAVEDSENGVRAAQAAGLRCIASPSRYGAEDDLSEADRVVACFSDIVSLARLIGAVEPAA